MSSGAKINAGGAAVTLGVKDQMARGLAMAKQRLESFAAGAMKIGGTLSAAAAGIVGPLLGASKVFANAGAPLDDLSKKIGVSGERLSELAFAAGQSGTDIDTVGKSFLAMSKVLYGADEASKGALDSIGDLGLSASQLQGLAPEKQFSLLADAISKVQDPSKRSALAMQVFGKSGAELLPMLENGSAGLAALAAEGHRLGVVLGNEVIAKAARYDDALDSLGKTISGVVIQIGGALAPMLTTFAQQAANVIAVIIEWIKNNGWLIQSALIVGTVLGTLGAAIIAAGGFAFFLANALTLIPPIVGAITATFTGLIGLLSAIASPIGIIVIAVGSLTAALLQMSGVLDPVWNYLAEGFKWLQGLVSQVVGGIADAIGSGQIGLAAQITFTGLKVAATTALESVLAIFGSSIDTMSRLLGELYKKLGQFTGALNQVRDWGARQFTKLGGFLTGTDVGPEIEAMKEAANAFSQSWDNVDTGAIANSIKGALDPSTYQAELDALVTQAAQAAQVAVTNGPNFDVAKNWSWDFDFDQAQRDIKAAEFASVGGLSVSALERQLPGAKSREDQIASNTKETVTQLKKAVSLLGEKRTLNFG